MYRLMYASESDAENVRPMLFYVRQNAMPKELVVEERVQNACWAWI
jgi:hypothetical protein